MAALSWPTWAMALACAPFTTASASIRPWGSGRLTACPWARALARSIRACCFTSCRKSAWRPMNWQFAYGGLTGQMFGKAGGQKPELRQEFDEFRPLLRGADARIHEIALTLHEKFHHMVNHQSGLLGVSEISPDMRDLLAKERDDVRATEAVALFCYQIKKWIGAFAAPLGGLDTLVFSGGIGENAPVIRARICEGLAFLDLHLDATANTNNAPVISTGASPVTVRVIRTNEELMIAKAVFQELA